MRSAWPASERWFTPDYRRAHPAELAIWRNMLIRTPAVKLFCQATIGRSRKPFTLFYNPIDKSLDPLVCNGCGVCLDMCPKGAIERKP